MKTDHLTSTFMALRQRLHRSALAYLKDDEDARDALQDTFVKLWKSEEMESDSEASSKLFVALKNICIDRIRRRRTVALEDSHMVSLKIEASTGEDMERLESLLTAGLTQVQRHIYSLSVHYSMDYEDIAKRMNMTEGAVRTQMCRVRKKISENYKILDR
ncbi:MAG: sigma-70 family RNA polymerase sigma factor [Muribaculaceae bacterium]|nr:sigma-70 family RNA polymerase sigma factor [Muribaculaceae bacterium]